MHDPTAQGVATVGSHRTTGDLPPSCVHVDAHAIGFSTPRLSMCPQQRSPALQSAASSQVMPFVLTTHEVATATQLPPDPTSAWQHFCVPTMQ